MNKRKWIFSLLLFPQYYHQYLFRGRANIQDLLHHCLLHFEAPKTHRCPTMLLFHSKIAKINLITVQTPLICQVMKDSYLFYYFSDLHHFVHIFHCVGYNIRTGSFSWQHIQMQLLSNISRFPCQGFFLLFPKVDHARVSY